MKQIIVRRLFQSFVELEKAILTAKISLSKKGDSADDMLQRIRMYEDILEKQRSLATALCAHASMGDWKEVARHVKLINGLSTMIRDDARELVRGSEVASLPPAIEHSYC